MKKSCVHGKEDQIKNLKKTLDLKFKENFDLYSHSDFHERLDKENKYDL